MHELRDEQSMMCYGNMCTYLHTHTRAQNNPSALCCVYMCTCKYTHSQINSSAFYWAYMCTCMYRHSQSKASALYWTYMCVCMYTHSKGSIRIMLNHACTHTHPSYTHACVYVCPDKDMRCAILEHTHTHILLRHSLLIT